MKDIQPWQRPFQTSDASVGNLSFVNAEVPQVGQARQVLQPSVGDLRVAEA